MSTTSDYVASLVVELDVVTESMISKLVAAPASEHDAIAGTIRGLAKAKKIALEHGRKFQAFVDEDDIEVMKPSKRQTTLNLS
jgi:hypothetical protein